MKYKAIIFDLDDVICFTDEYHYLAWKALADRLGISFDRKRNNLLCWVSRMQSLEIIWEKSSKTYSENENAAFAEEKNQTYCELLRLIGQLCDRSASRKSKQNYATSQSSDWIVPFL